MSAAPKRLKAYQVDEDHEGHAVIAFATNNATARREGGRELDLEFEEVSTCRRAPQFDEYAPGPVPPLVLIEDGWWFTCLCCGRRVSEDMADELYDDDLDPADFVPQEAGKNSVYCSATCSQRDWREKRDNATAKADLLELFEAKFPGATALHVHVYGQRLEATEKGHGQLCNVRFKFPGAQYGGTWCYGEEGIVHISAIDVDAFKLWQATLKPGGV